MEEVNVLHRRRLLNKFLGQMREARREVKMEIVPR